MNLYKKVRTLYRAHPYLMVGVGALVTATIGFFAWYAVAAAAGVGLLSFAAVVGVKVAIAAGSFFAASQGACAVHQAIKKSAQHKVHAESVTPRLRSGSVSPVAPETPVILHSPLNKVLSVVRRLFTPSATKVHTPPALSPLSPRSMPVSQTQQRRARLIDMQAQELKALRGRLDQLKEQTRTAIPIMVKNLGKLYDFALDWKPSKRHALVNLLPKLREKKEAAVADVIAHLFRGVITPREVEDMEPEIPSLLTNAAIPNDKENLLREIRAHEKFYERYQKQTCLCQQLVERNSFPEALLPTYRTSHLLKNALRRFLGWAKDSVPMEVSPAYKPSPELEQFSELLNRWSSARTPAGAGGPVRSTHAAVRSTLADVSNRVPAGTALQAVPEGRAVRRALKFSTPTNEHTTGEKPVFAHDNTALSSAVHSSVGGTLPPARRSLHI